MIGHMPSKLQELILTDTRRKAVPAGELRERYGRSVYAAITALEARGLVEIEWDVTEYPPQKIVKAKQRKGSQ